MASVRFTATRHVTRIDHFDVDIEASEIRDQSLAQRIEDGLSRMEWEPHSSERGETLSDASLDIDSIEFS